MKLSGVSCSGVRQMSEKTFTQGELTELMQSHRIGLQTTIKTQEAEIEILRLEILRLSGQPNTQATNPLVNLLFRTLVREMEKTQ